MKYQIVLVVKVGDEESRLVVACFENKDWAQLFLRAANADAQAEGKGAHIVTEDSLVWEMTNNIVMYIAIETI